MSLSVIIVLAALFFLTAALYASVGHAGASGYLAAMALVGVSPAVMRPTALALNILVATIASVQYARVRAFSWRTFWPFALPAVPAAFFGGRLVLPVRTYSLLVGAILLYAAVRLLAPRRDRDEQETLVPVVAALVAGTIIGLLSGLVGVGGGIFLTPLLLLRRWSTPRIAAGVSAVFILVNSVAGLAGHTATIGDLPPDLPILALAAALGGWLGATYGATRADPILMRRLLAVVLLIASTKMFATAVSGQPHPTRATAGTATRALTQIPASCSPYWPAAIPASRRRVRLAPSSCAT